jgi:hypothetical protein
MAKATAAEGLDAGLLDRAASLEAGLPQSRLHDSADLHRGWPATSKTWTPPEPLWSGL